MRVERYGVLLVLSLVLFATAGCGGGAEPESASLSPEAEVVASALEPGNLEIVASDLESMDNPKGDGTLVFIRETQFNGVERNFIWLVLDGTAYPLNGASKDVSPGLGWPRDVPEAEWAKSGLDPYMATEVIEIVFGN